MLGGAIGALGSENVTAGFELPIRKRKRQSVEPRIEKSVKIRKA